ncbi:hypothetical protein M409DRAFT_25541 [Zasmidium cellare ATCC 36951]|uniref:Uncharacterized protein n=1 Tax=Zasmidium cellare ATCC 36951 TaxID=1080233 RepID=A0A6A6CDE4_ZASCE|nr:uncharacterized protein M409DRAFT_25541 [Zasmidium cellare ATCC 36951]KAF2164198.1 hypothetical protein M409DRAFT_25541 [Zasmidium cellare ATCC 36951]
MDETEDIQRHSCRHPRRPLGGPIPSSLYSSHSRRKALHLTEVEDSGQKPRSEKSGPLKIGKERRHLLRTDARPGDGTEDSEQKPELEETAEAAEDLERMPEDEAAEDPEQKPRGRIQKVCKYTFAYMPSDGS